MRAKGETKIASERGVQPLAGVVFLRKPAGRVERQRTPGDRGNNGCRRSSAFWRLGCPKTYHEVEDSLERELFLGTPHRIVKMPQPLSWGFLLQTTYQTELRIEDGTAFGRERHLTDPAVSSILTMGLPSREMTVSVCRPTVRPGRPHRQQCVVCRPMSQWVTRAFDWARRSRLLSASTGHSPAGYFNRQNAVYAEVRERVLPANSGHSWVRNCRQLHALKQTY